jgi:hypothetical protein
LLAVGTSAVDAGDRIQVPLRWCAIKGSPVASDPDISNALWKRHENATDKIWSDGANITFRSAIIREIIDVDHAKFPVIEDPRPPGMGPGVEGDILVPFPSPADAELKEARNDCDIEWDELEIDINNRRNALDPPLPPVNIEGLIVINLREYVQENGEPDPFLGGAGFFGPTGGKCQDPPVITSVDPTQTFAGVQDNTFLSGDVEELLAHEFGHMLGLEHGNGLDDDNEDGDDDANTGLFDGYPGRGCDPDENVEAAPFSLMATSTINGTDLITPLQRRRARAAAPNLPGMKSDPPGILIDGDTVGDHRTDPAHDVTDDAVDIVSAGMIVNNVAQTTVLSHMLFGILPERPNNQYLMFLDLDGDPATGGAPSTLGLPTSFQGAELVTRVVVRTDGEIPVRTITPTVWKFQLGGFVVVTDPSVLAHAETSVEAETGVSSFEVISIEMANSVTGDISAQLRLQAVAQQIDGTQLDQLPDGPTNGDAPLFMVPPQFPACGVTPFLVQKGVAATVEATGLLPNQMAKVLLGDQMVASGTIDGDGNAAINFVIPSNAAEGVRLVTAGVAGTALTADCSVEVAAGLPVPPIPVAVDVKPRSCPNPLNVRKAGVLSVAILGSNTFDATLIDPTLVKLQGVSPLRSALEDVTTPFIPFTGKVNATDCTEAGADGYLDLTLKFDAQAVANALGAVTDGEVRGLELTGNLKPEFEGTPLVGEDVIVIRKK